MYIELVAATNQHKLLHGNSSLSEGHSVITVENSVENLHQQLDLN